MGISHQSVIGKRIPQLLTAAAACLVLAHTTPPTLADSSVCNPVTSTADDGSPGTLRYALACVDPGEIITFAPGVTGTILLTNGELLVTNDVSILGPGPNQLAINGNAASSVFDISPGLVVTIASLTITSGNATLGGGINNDGSTVTVSNCTVSGNSAVLGGGIYNNSDRLIATLTILNSTVNGNLATDEGGGIYNDGNVGNASVTISNCTVSGNMAEGDGGGIYNDGDGYGGSATLEIVNSTVSSNTAATDGGGLYNAGDIGTGTVAIVNCTLSGNKAETDGGGIENAGDSGTATLTILYSTISSNTAATDGGGIDNAGDFGTATLTILNSTISSNLAETVGGGIENDGDSGTATLTIVNSTLSGNTAGIDGGGIDNEDDEGLASLMIANSTIVGNKSILLDSGGGIYNENLRGPGTATIGSSIVALNSANPGPDVLGSFISTGFNLIGQTNGATGWIASDLVGSTAAPLNPLLGPLQDNGGPTFTHALLCGSPAIDKGTNYTGALYDQRGVGFARTVDDPSVLNAAGGEGTDIGAYELQQLCTPVTAPSITTRQQPASAPLGNSIADKATVSGGNNPTGTVTFALYNNPNGYGTPLFTDTETLWRSSATSRGYKPNVMGTFYWVATYNGNANNAPVTSSSAAEPVTITLAKPCISTSQQPASTTVGSTIADKATVSGGYNPTGTVTFKLYSTSKVTGTPLFTDTEPLVGGSATSKGYKATTTGTFYWVATFNGDSNNSPVTSGTDCEPVAICPAKPTITTTPQPASAPVGSTIADKATISGGYNPTGTVTFKLCNNSKGTGTPLFTDTEPLVGGTATSKGYKATVRGTVYWAATYNGDSNNSPVSSGAASEPVSITSTH